MKKIFQLWAVTWVIIICHFPVLATNSSYFLGTNTEIVLTEGYAYSEAKLNDLLYNGEGRDVAVYDFYFDGVDAEHFAFHTSQSAININNFTKLSRGTSSQFHVFFELGLPAKVYQADLVVETEVGTFRNSLKVTVQDPLTMTPSSKSYFTNYKNVAEVDVGYSYRDLSLQDNLYNGEGTAVAIHDFHLEGKDAQYFDFFADYSAVNINQHTSLSRGASTPFYLFFDSGMPTGVYSTDLVVVTAVGTYRSTFTVTVKSTTTPSTGTTTTTPSTGTTTTTPSTGTTTTTPSTGTTYDVYASLLTLTTRSAVVGVPLTLQGTVSPSNATYQDITWSMNYGSSDGATIENGVFLATKAGTYMVQGNIYKPDTNISTCINIYSVTVTENSTTTTTPSTGTTTTAPSTGTTTTTPSTGTTAPSIPSGDNIYPITGTTVNYPTQEQIAKFYFDSAKDAITTPTSYASDPNVSSPYSAGVLSDATNQGALTTINYIRYIAGLDYNLTIGDSYVEITQAGAFLNAVNGTLTHSPSQPSGMSDELYRLGASGASSSNIASGYSTLGSAITSGWMNDGDSSNIARVGHRRWILNPIMGKIAFGMTGRYSAMYCFDYSNTAGTQTGVTWPAQNTPISLFNATFPWSFSHATDINSASVKLTRLNDGQVWNFSTSSADGYFGIVDGGYNRTDTIIFRPNSVSYEDGDVFHVQILGDVSASYCVNFFDVESTTPASSLTPSSTPTYYEYVHQEKVDLSYLDGSSTWAEPWITEAYNMGILEGMSDIMSKYTSDITREEFCRLIVNVYESTGKTGLTGTNPFSDTNNQDVISAYHLGIVSGTSATTFSPNSKITRQELAVMVKKTAEHFATISGLSSTTSFSDHGTIATWARESVFYAQREGFLAGSNGNIRPLDNLTCEEAIIVAFRLADTF